jgi:hypothetical protein
VLRFWLGYTLGYTFALRVAFGKSRSDHPASPIDLGRRSSTTASEAA